MSKTKETTTRGSTAIKKRKRRRIFVIMASVLCLYFAVTFFSQQATIYDQQRVKESINQEIADIENEQALIRNNIDFSTSDEFIERQAREKLGWVKENEIKFLPENTE